MFPLGNYALHYNIDSEKFIYGLLTMATSQSKASLLSAQLDFEDVDGNALKAVDAELADLKFDLPSDPAPKAPADVRSAPKTQARATPAKPVLTHRKTQKKDNFALYAAIIALCSFVVIFSAIFYIKVIAKDETTPSYLALPKTVVNVDGQVIRLQVTIQVQNKNRDWLATNKKALSDIFPIVVAKINPEDLHSEEGFERVREMLRSELNQSLATDKIDSVLINELLMQNH